ncbi:MAG: hypothetical protein GY856_36550 [bacterium]|nr:hypothetical protein [bacterium]
MSPKAILTNLPAAALLITVICFSPPLPAAAGGPVEEPGADPASAAPAAASFDVGPSTSST